MNSFKISGIVVGGNRIGRTLGFPTANIACDTETDIERGVYAVRVDVGDGKRYEGIANFGVRPSVDGGRTKDVLEVNIFGYDGELYGQRVDVEFLEFIRPEKKFGSLEELKTAIGNDRLEVEKYFKYK